MPYQGFSLVIFIIIIIILDIGNYKNSDKWSHFLEPIVHYIEKKHHVTFSLIYVYIRKVTMHTLLTIDIS